MDDTPLRILLRCRPKCIPDRPRPRRKQGHPMGETGGRTGLYHRRCCILESVKNRPEENTLPLPNWNVGGEDMMPLRRSNQSDGVREPPSCMIIEDNRRRLLDSSPGGLVFSTWLLLGMLSLLVLRVIIQEYSRRQGAYLTQAERAVQRILSLPLVEGQAEGYVARSNQSLEHQRERGDKTAAGGASDKTSCFPARRDNSNKDRPQSLSSMTLA
jgi:hypothetical protein